MIFENLDRIVFAGDSVTDMGSAQPVGEGLFDNLGKGYVRVVDSMLAVWYPELKLRITNSGISGNTSRDLLARFDRDVIDLKPDWLSICIGINDVWRQFDSPAILSDQVDLEEYTSNLTTMIKRAKSELNLKGLFIISPYFMEPCKDDAMRKRIDEYVAVCKKLAKEFQCTYIDFQAVYDDYLKYRHSSYITWDRIHPNQVGATLMAREFLKHCGFDFNR
ncbi:MAG: SGNH/GDSL hydrolase family protein [Clostridia bacterium]|nr:SGNH/GDSL hydrolase family protein [Clostridia bacterium]